MNLSSLASDCGVTHNTAGAWMSVLEASDLLVERGAILQPVEIKAGQTIAQDSFTALARWRALAGPEAQAGWIVYAGEQDLRHGDVNVVGWRGLPERLAEL